MGDLNVGTLLDGRWRIGRKIGEGACAKVYDVTPVGKDATTIDFPLVAKVIALPKSGSKSAKDKEQRRLCDTLYHEYNVCVNNFHDLPYLPRRPLRFYGESEGNRYLVMEKLERDLLDVAKRGDSSVQDVAHFGLQILDGLKSIHYKGYFFIDIKPDNFMLKGDKLFFVDFGLVERRPNTTSALFGAAPEAGRSFAGTATYASIDALSGKNPTVSDEIQSMVYVLLAVLNGGILPWSGAKSDAELLRMKKDANLCDFSNSLGAGELGVIFQEACQSVVDYNRIESLLRTMLSKTENKKVAAKPKARAPINNSKAISQETEDSSVPQLSKNESSVKRRRGLKIAPSTSTNEVRTNNLVRDLHNYHNEETNAPVRRGRSANKTTPVVVDSEATNTTARKTTAIQKGKFAVSINKARAVAVNTDTKNKFDEDEESDTDKVEIKKRKVSRSQSPDKKRSNISVTKTASDKKKVPSTTVSDGNSSKNRKIVIQNEVPFSPNKSAILVDPDDILGFEDGMPTYLNACLDDVYEKPQNNNSANRTGPFSMRKSEYHRHRLSSLGGDSVEESR